MSLKELVAKEINEGNIPPEMRDCIAQQELGCIGRYQMQWEGAKYCMRSTGCPLQADSELNLTLCTGDKYLAEFVDKTKKYWQRP